MPGPPPPLRPSPVLRNTGARAIAAAERTGNPALIAAARYKAAEDIFEFAQIPHHYGNISDQEFERLQHDRDLAAASTQPAPSQSPPPATAPAELPPLPGRWETSSITDTSSLNTITHITLLFSPDHTLTGRSDFKDNTHIPAKGTWALQLTTSSKSPPGRRTPETHPAKRYPPPRHQKRKRRNPLYLQENLPRSHLPPIPRRSSPRNSLMPSHPPNS